MSFKLRIKFASFPIYYFNIILKLKLKIEAELFYVELVNKTVLSN
jgi:hypothetical protein